MWVVLTCFQRGERGEKADAHIDRAVAEGEHPAVSGHRGSRRVPQIELTLQKGVFRTRGGVVAPGGHAHRVVPAPLVPQLPSESIHGAIGNDTDHRGDDLLGTVVVQGDPGEKTILDHRCRRGLLHDPHPLLLGEGGNLGIEVTASHHASPTREARVLRPFELDVLVPGVGAKTGDAMELGHVELESHFLELENRPGSQSVATSLVPGIFLLLHQRHIVAVPGQPVGGRRAGGAATDDENGGRRHRRRG